MYIKKAHVKNFKSISDIEIPFDKVNDSYTKIFVGINESGKSNILEALSFFNVPKTKVSADMYCNQKMVEESEYPDINFHLELDEKEMEALKAEVNNRITSKSKLNFSITGIKKHIYLPEKASNFICEYRCKIDILDSNLYIKQIIDMDGESISIVDELHKTDDCQLLDEKRFLELFHDVISHNLEKNEPLVSMWKPSEEYLLCDAKLNEFKEKPYSNRPLFNIFKLSGYKDKAAITEVVGKIKDARNRSRLESKLNESINEYISKVWNNSIDVIIEITETGAFSLLIKDKGEENKHDRFSIADRSQGAKHFLSIILSLSIETANQDRKNELILIDEPEVHLHPSGIRDLSKELLKIGKENYVFISTHSPFMIDKMHRERHFVVKKDKRAITGITRINDYDNLIDDEVLKDAFGINVYRELLNPYSILVEGSTDKIILKKAFNILGFHNIGITNGHGSNIDTLASKMNYDDISVMVIVDDDEEGKKYKKNIAKIGGNYSEDTVFTIRDIEGEIISGGTIEDTLGVKFVESQFLRFYKTSFDEELTGVSLTEDKPVIMQITTILKKKKKYNNWNMDSLKKQLSEEFNPPKTTFSKNYRLLASLAKKIVEKLK